MLFLASLLLLGCVILLVSALNSLVLSLIELVVMVNELLQRLGLSATLDFLVSKEAVENGCSAE